MVIKSKKKTLEEITYMSYRKEGDGANLKYNIGIFQSISFRDYFPLKWEQEY